LELRGTRGFVHVSATAIAGPPLPQSDAMTPPEALAEFSTPMPAVYAQQLFHGEVLHAIEGVDGIAKAGMTLRLRTHPTSELLLPGPGHLWTIDPLALDGCVRSRSVMPALDRKSTRLNSSHVEISYAVFCLKKKK